MQAKPNTRVLADVPHVVGGVAVLGHDPELVAAQPVADRHAARRPTLSPGRLEQRVRAGEEAALEQATHDRVHELHGASQNLRDQPVDAEPDDL